VIFETFGTIYNDRPRKIIGVYERRGAARFYLDPNKINSTVPRAESVGMVSLVEFHRSIC